MSLRRVGVLALPLALAACTKVTQEPQAPEIVFARYTSPDVPTPNDLALAALPAVPSCSVLPLTSFQILCAYRAAGGWPSDQESAISVPFTAVTWDPAAGEFGAYVPAAAPAIDTGSVTDATVAVYRVDVDPIVRVQVEASSVAGSCTGAGAAAVCKPATLILRKVAGANGRRWDAAARYTVGVRGGALGVKTTTGQPVNADFAIAVAIQNKDQRIPENQPLGAVPDSNGSGSNADEIASLEGVRKALWNQVTWSFAGGVWKSDTAAGITPAFTAIAGAFPVEEVASLATFGTAPLSSPVVLLDTGSLQIPVPSDFLLGSNGKVRDLSSLVCDPGVTGCPVAQAMSTLDGFSTTAPNTFNTTAAVKAGALPANSVLFFDLGPVGQPLAVPVLLGDLAQATSGAQVAGASYAGKVVGTTVALATATAVPLSATTSRYLPPLKEHRQYAVVITDKLLGTGDVPFARNTLSKILWGVTTPLFAGGKSQLPGISDADAAGLQALRDGLNPVLTGALPAFTGGALTKANVVTAYTIRTQSVTAGSVAMSAAPYSPSISAVAPTVTANLTPAQWEGATGFPAAALPGVSKVLAGKFASVDPVAPNGLLNPTQGAWVPVQLDYLAAVPANAACTPGAPCAAPVVVFHHGLTGSRVQMLPFAAALAAKGFVTVATDAPFHGDRAFCAVDADCLTEAGGTGTCTVTPATPGAPAHCAAGETLKFDPVGLSTTASGNYFVSGNFFRIRDAIRHDLLDQSALIVAAAPPAARAGDAFAAALLAEGYLVDPTRVYYAGQSLGAIIGTSVLATNPRISRGVLNVGGGTLVDVFTTSATFTAQPSGAGSSALEKAIQDVVPGFTLQAAQTDPVIGAKYQQLLLLAKWILDPADPINYAANVQTKLASPLDAAAPAGLGGTPLHFAATDVYTQMAQGDLVVPNATNLELDTLIGAPPTLYQTAAGGAVTHGYLISKGPFNVMQTDAAAFLDALVVPATNPAVAP